MPFLTRAPLDKGTRRSGAPSFDRSSALLTAFRGVLRLEQQTMLAIKSYLTSSNYFVEDGTVGLTAYTQSASSHRLRRVVGRAIAS